MIKKIKRIVKYYQSIRSVLRFGVYYLSELGWLESSKRGMPLNKNSEPIPWLTYPAIKFIESKLEFLNNVDLLEYGCGGSTLWWAKNHINVFSIEHNVDFYKKIKKENIDRVTLILRSSEHGIYQSSAYEFNRKFDVIVIDGIQRLECIENTINLEKESTIIILDNSHREELKTAYEKLINRGYKSIDFFGPTALSPYESCTTIFYRKKNLMRI
jgi:precorrin-6B methylase 2